MPPHHLPLIINFNKSGGHNATILLTLKVMKCILYRKGYVFVYHISFCKGGEGGIKEIMINRNCVFPKEMRHELFYHLVGLHRLWWSVLLVQKPSHVLELSKASSIFIYGDAFAFKSTKLILGTHTHKICWHTFIIKNKISYLLY